MPQIHARGEEWEAGEIRCKQVSDQLYWHPGYQYQIIGLSSGFIGARVNGRSWGWYQTSDGAQSSRSFVHARNMSDLFIWCSRLSHITHNTSSDCYQVQETVKTIFTRSCVCSDRTWRLRHSAGFCCQSALTLRSSHSPRDVLTWWISHNVSVGLSLLCIKEETCLKVHECIETVKTWRDHRQSGCRFSGERWLHSDWFTAVNPSYFYWFTGMHPPHAHTHTHTTHLRYGGACCGGRGRPTVGGAAAISCVIKEQWSGKRELAAIFAAASSSEGLKDLLWLNWNSHQLIFSQCYEKVLE